MSENSETDEPAGSEDLPRSTPIPRDWWEPPEAGGGAPSGGEDDDSRPFPEGQPLTSGYPLGGPPHANYPPGAEWWGGPAWGPSSAMPPRPAWYLRPIVLAVLIAATVGAGIGFGHVLWPVSSSSPAAVSSPGNSSGGSSYPFNGSGGTDGSGSSGSANTAGPSDASSIAAKVDPAMVDVNVTFNGQEPGAGTGIVLTSNGEVLTNNHVVEGATSISVTDIGNGKTYGATVVGYDATDDVAVIQLTHASGLKTAKIGNSSGAAVGDAVVAIGNAGGTGGTPTATGGSITALDQAITASDEISGVNENLTGLIETDANIQPGDSGGSLVNASGEVIGMDTAAAQGFALSSQTNQGYAIPINKALSIAAQIESGSGSSTVHVGPTAYLGVFVSTSGSGSSPYSGGYFDPFGSQAGSSTTRGAVISGVAGGGPAAKAGLTEGDAITSIDGQSVGVAADLSSLVQQRKPGEKVQVGWTDTSGQTHTSAITLGSGPAQ
jgi:S1-C subfamily serine protease